MPPLHHFPTASLLTIAVNYRHHPRFYKLYLFGQLAGLVWWVDDLVIKNGEVESKTEPDGMCRLHFWLCYVKCFLICFLWILDYRCNANREIQITIPPNLYVERNLSFCCDIYVKAREYRNKMETGKEHEQPFRVIFTRDIYRIRYSVRECTIQLWKQKKPPEYKYGITKLKSAFSFLSHKK